MGIGAAALLEKHWRPPISGNKTKRMVAGPHNEWQETQTENTSDTARVSHNGQRIGHMTVHQLQETQAENTSDLEAAGRLASKARKTHNATMSRLQAEAEDEHTRWVAKHAMFQQKLESTTKDTHNITLGSNLGSHHITFEVTLPESSPESIIPRGRESSPESSRCFSSESSRFRSVHLPPGQTVESIDAGRGSFKSVTLWDTLEPVDENANHNYVG